MTAPRPLPLYVEPAADEALPSWLSRLAARLHVSLPEMTEHMLGVKIPANQPGWWQRLHPWHFPRMAQISAVSVSRLRAMTLIDWSPPVRHDEAPDRFSGLRFKARTADPATQHFSVCPRCVLEDAEPYLRLEWMLGWIAVCPQHAIPLIHRCPHCRCRLRIPASRSPREIPILRCGKCHQPLSPTDRLTAHPRVMQLQAALLAANRSGTCELSLIGAMSWSQLLVLADSLLKIFWTTLASSDRHPLLSWIQYDLCLPLRKDQGRWHDRYESLAILSWFLEVPRYNTGVHFTAEDLDHWIFHHAHSVLDDEGRALLQRNSMSMPLQARLRDLVSMLPPFAHRGHFALRSNNSESSRPLKSHRPNSGI